MLLKKIRNNTFHRIGDRYADYFDADHFLGRSAMDSFDKAKPKVMVSPKHKQVKKES